MRDVPQSIAAADFKKIFLKKLNENKFSCILCSVKEICYLKSVSLQNHAKI